MASLSNIANAKSWRQALSDLKKKPTVQGWEIELENVLRGNRRYLLKDDESAADYVESLVVTSDKAVGAESRVYLRKALHNIVQSWQPSEFEGAVYVNHLLDLIANYTPEPGFQKVLAFLKQHGHFGAESDRLYDSDVDLNLRWEALLAIQEYFSTAPARRSAPFKAYVRLLKDLLEDARYSGYAVGRLVELGQYGIDDPKIRDLIGQQTDSLPDLVAYALDSSNHAAVERSLTQLYKHCLIINQEHPEGLDFLDQFTLALQESSAKLGLGEDLRPLVQHRHKMYNVQLLDFEEDLQKVFI